MILLHRKEEARFFHTHVSIYLVGTLEDILVKGNLNNNCKSTVKLRIKCYEFLYTQCVPRSGRAAQSTYWASFKRPLCPNTAICHCSCKTCPSCQPFHYFQGLL